MHVRHPFRPLLLAFVSMLFATACERAPTRSARSLGLLSSVPIPNFLPTSSTQMELQWFTMLAYEGLTAPTPQGGVVPALAREWRSDDGLHWRFALRSGVTFHDGTPFRAQHVLDAWRTVLRAAPGTAEHMTLLDVVEGVQAFNRGEATDISGLRAVGDTAIEITLVRANAAFPAVLAANSLSIIGPGGSATRINGTGPWRLPRGVPRDSLYAFARHERYWGAAPKFDSLRFVVVRDLPELNRALEAGTLDCVYAGESGMPLALRTDFAMKASPPHVSALLTLNHRNSLLRQPAVREAIHLAIDRRALARALELDAPIMRTSLLAPGLVPWDTVTEALRADPARARALLAPFRVERAAPLRIAWFQPDTVYPVLQTLRNQLAAVGIRTVVKAVPDNAAPAFLDNTVDLQLWRWASPYPAPDAMLLGMFHSKAASGLGNTFAFADPEVDSLFDRERAMPAGPARDSAIVAIGRVLFERRPAILLWYAGMMTASSKRVTECPSGLYANRYTDIGPADR